jgi:FkbH-like protein
MSDTDTALHWLTPLGDFTAELRAARGAPESERLARFVSLACRRLGFLETLQLDRAVQDACSRLPPGLTPIRLAVLGNTTVDHLLPAIRVAGLRFRLWIDTYAPAYAQSRQELLAEESGLARFRPDTILLALDAMDEVAAIPLSEPAESVDARVRAIIEDLRILWHAARSRLGATVIQQTALNIAHPLFGSYDAGVAAAPATVVASLNAAARTAAFADGVMLLDIARISEQLGTARWFDPARWHQAKQSIAPTIAPLYGDYVGRLLASLRGLARKCLVLDLDNTLWGGVVGDDGLQGIVLGQGNAAGEAYVEFQRYAKRLSERGVLLAVCSKNAPEIAEAVFRDHPEMVLSRNDISAFAVNWNDKPSNLRTIAEELNIGVDSLVFFDDNPFEREMVRKALPSVAVPEVPEDCAFYTRTLADAGYFESLSFTQEDRDRVRLYAANAERERVRGGASDVHEFLRQLDMRLKAEPFAAVDLPRVTQLINKTNQFNVMTRRYSQDEVTAMAGDPQILTFQARLRDRLGDNGLISVVILKPLQPGDTRNLHVDTWLMSCRVLGRQVEHELCNYVMETAAAHGATRVLGTYRPTEKNGLVRDLFASLGFQPAGEGEGGSSLWEMSVRDYRPHSTFVARE